MGFTAAGISPTTNTTTQQAPLGFELTVPNGDKGNITYIYVKNSSGGTIAANDMVQRKDSGDSTAVITNYEVAEAAASQQSIAIVGCAIAQILDGSYAFVIKKGIATVNGAAAVVHNRPLIMSGTAGQVAGDDDDSDLMSFGQSLGGRADAGTFEAYINCMG